MGLAKAIDLHTVLSTKDLYDLIEIMTVDAYNRRLAAEAARAEQD